ncbi:MAG TPA: hypothetical protein VLG13_03325 [Patescibacteria group bacterium]|nr:hypothetical protein [Patescibacteria group bacterium]
MDNQPNPRQQLTERLKTANNVLVTVSANPSVDQLAACIGLTIWLNKLGKHATAVFSGEVPSTLEFLQPETTLEKNTDSLRDFIIALDKSKADKLRYKVEDRVVKIFITPYRTSLSADDLEFSQGDFNVDVVVCLGVQKQEDLDNAITSHGRILHDATVTTVNTTEAGGLGSINWNDTQASSLSELVVSLGKDLGKEQLDGQIATALLTGIVAETARFSNEKTSPTTMSVSAELMSSGANQQLVVSKLEGPTVDLRDNKNKPSKPKGQDKQRDKKKPEDTTDQKPDDGTLEIGHAKPEDQPAGPSLPAPIANDADVTDVPTDEPAAPRAEAQESSHLANEGQTSKFVTEPPMLGGTLTANSRPDDRMEPSTDPFSLPATESNQPLLSRADSAPPQPAQTPPEPAPAPTAEPTQPEPFSPQPGPFSWTPPSLSTQPANQPQTAPTAPVDQPTNPDSSGSLADIEQSVHSPHVDSQELDAARSEVMSALSSAPDPAAPEPIQALNAQSIDLNQQPPADTPATPASIAFDPSAFQVDGDVPGSIPAMTMPMPPQQSMTQPPAAPQASDPNAPPPVPPPIPFQFGGPTQNQQ